MKNIILIIALSFFVFSCDKVTNPLGNKIVTDLDTNLYPGNYGNYVDSFPVFNVNTNTFRNVLLEDYTGHKCIFCPAAAVLAKQIEEAPASNGRVFVASIHASPLAGGLGSFQQTDADYPTDLTNPIGLAYGDFFQSGYGFTGNPRGTVNRRAFGGDIFSSPGQWQSRVNTTFSENELKVNLQARLDYFPSTRGVFLHVEVDEIVANPAYRIDAWLIEDSLISKQILNPGVDPNYVHHNLHRGSITNLAFGRLVSSFSEVENGKKIIRYSYALPINIAPTNAHFLIYVFDDVTKEIVQVIKKAIQ